MNMTMSADHTKRIHYERLPNGMDAYIIPTVTDDVVVATFALSGGMRMSERSAPVVIMQGMLPGSTTGLNRARVRTRIASLGANISFSVTDHHALVSVSSRAEVFVDALAIAVESISQPLFPQREFIEARTHADTALVNAEEDTGLRAAIAFSQSVYRKGHPHFIKMPTVERRELAELTRADVARFHKDALTTVGGYIIIAGDIPASLSRSLSSLLGSLPSTHRGREPIARLDKTAQPAHKDIIVSLADKMNVDTVLGIPLTLTRDHPDYHALSMGVQVLGGSFSSRLFRELRDVRNYTYGAYAGLRGMEDGYPGFLSAKAIFPNDVFKPARSAFRDVVHLWAEKGITPKELEARKEELCGRYVVDLASTRGLMGAVHGVVRFGKPLTYLDEYPDIIRGVRVRDVNAAIQEHVRYDLAVTAAAGSIDAVGAPLG